MQIYNASGRLVWSLLLDRLCFFRSDMTDQKIFFSFCLIFLGDTILMQSIKVLVDFSLNISPIFLFLKVPINYLMNLSTIIIHIVHIDNVQIWILKSMTIKIRIKWFTDQPSLLYLFSSRFVSTLAHGKWFLAKECFEYPKVKHTGIAYQFFLCRED